MMKKVNKKNDEVNYKDEGKHEKFVSNSNFIEPTPTITPLSVRYKKEWKVVKRKCIEGLWKQGKWMPGNLYFYINLCRIEISKDVFATSKVIGSPFLRDLEWEKAYVYAEARGFSGFMDDDENSCYKGIIGAQEDFNVTGSIDKVKYRISDHCINSKGELKTYIPARAYLRRIHSKNLGKPLYQNEASNVIDIECRGSGKSFWGGNGMILHNFLMDGATDYDEFLASNKRGDKVKSQTLVGAIDGKYSKDLLDKVQTGIDELKGQQVFQGVDYHSPLHKATSGSWYSGKQFIQSKVDIKSGGNWTKKGSASTIYHRSFGDNPHAGTGTRPSLTCLEEVGLFDNLIFSLAAMKDTSYNGPVKFGTIYMFGTGGDMEGGASEQAMEVFNDPASYDCLSFEDTWEETGSIGYFVPYEMGLNDYKDKEGNTDWPRATEYVDIKREALASGKNKASYYKEMQNNPRFPSEAFLIMNSNVFPVGELKEHYGWLKSQQHDGFVKGQNGELIWAASEGKVPKAQWVPDLNNKLTPCGFKMNKSEDTTGCIQIWEHPQEINGQIPFGLYVAGTDPYDHDQSVSTSSLGSTFIYKTFSFGEGIYEWPVAEYTARPATVEEHHENVRKLLTYYNAKDLYENERNSLKMHFSHKHSLHLLAKTPTMLKSIEGSKVQRGYGIHMPVQVKGEIELLTRDWLLQETGDGKLNLHKIYSLPLLQELIYYNRDGNFDRVISFMLTIVHRLNNYHIKVEEVKKETTTQDSFLGRLNAGKLFK